MAEPGRVAEPEPELWCRGCRRVGQRPLSGEERAWIQALRQAHQVRAAIGAVIVPVGFALGLVAAIAMERSETVSLVVGVWWFLTLGIGVPVSVLLVRDHLRAMERLGRDLASASAAWFEPPARRFATPIPFDHEARGVAREPQSPDATPFALLEHSRRIVDPVDRSPRVLHEDVIEVEPHSAAQLYAPLSLPRAEAKPGLRLAQRALGASERAELEHVSHQLQVPGASAWIALAVLFLVVAMVFVARREHWPVRGGISDLFSTAVVIAACLNAVARHVRALRLAGRIRQDLSIGLVVHAVGETGPEAEVLPFSGVLWRVQGAPAQWRDRRGAVGRLRAGL
jgi:hypothetical protein